MADVGPDDIEGPHEGEAEVRADPAILAELDARYVARMRELIKQTPGRLPRPVWFRASFSNWDGTGIYHSDRECFAVREVVDGEAQADAHLYELDLATGDAWSWTHQTYSWPEEGDLPKGWYRDVDQPSYYPGIEAEDVVEWLAEGWDPIQPVSDTASRHIQLDAEQWRACYRCGDASQTAPPTCGTCWLTPCECED